MTTPTIHLASTPLPTQPLWSSRSNLPAMMMVQTPRGTQRLAKLLVVCFCATPLLLLLPWQQTVTASGKLMAFDPTYRQQFVKAPIDGRVMEWRVVEGTRVEAGELLVRLLDPDSRLVDNLQTERAAIQERIDRTQERVESLSKQQGALLKSQKDAHRAASNRLEMGRRRLESSRQAVTASKEAFRLADFSMEMQAGLKKKGLTSGLEFQMAETRYNTATAELERARQAELAATSEVDALSADLAKVGNDIEAAIQGVEALRQAAVADVASARRDMAQIQVRLNRQMTQEVCAPCAGWVFRVLANARDGGILVKQGDNLMILVPEIPSPEGRVVELIVDGNDSPLITELIRHQESGAESQKPRLAVRLQFEGWPAVQVVGWPSLAMGTFGGLVDFVDRTDDGKGKFRILVRPDPEEEVSNPWPPDYALRQGVRANGWVFLNRVTIGYELWRRFNGFPAVLPAEEAKGDKEGKIKVPK
ncbi:MAG: HlyD family secretion protein [Gemmataceae bacterium]|nr:HlyD family secretion protein [Gemmataceae bacterium]